MWHLIDGEGKKLWAIGFGNVDGYEGSEYYADHLQEAELAFVDLDECSRDHYVDETMICAEGDTSFISGACFGDSGGPLYDFKNEVLVGVTSFGKDPCGREPAVFSNIADQWGWIRHTICSNHGEENYPSFCEGYTFSPSQSPSLSPTFTPCSSDQVQVLLNIQTDYYPRETSWSLKDLDGDYTIIETSYSKHDENSYFDYSFCIQPTSCHSFVMRDECGDGIYDTYGSGYNLSVDGDVLLSSTEHEGGNFGFRDKIKFGCENGSNEKVRMTRQISVVLLLITSAISFYY